MYNFLLQIHSITRYFILASLIIVLAMSLVGMMNKKPYGKWDNKFSLYLLIFTHLQALVGIILYFVSPNVVFGPDTMKLYRYWTVEHLIGMLIAVVLITIARISSKKMTDDGAKHKRLFIFNLIALIVIIATIYSGKMGLFQSRFF